MVASCIATSHKIPSKLIYSSPNVEMIAVEISVSPPLIICCLYIPPSSPEPYITEVLSALDHLPYGHHTIILGDLNLPSIDWSTLSASSHLGTTAYWNDCPILGKGVFTNIDTIAAFFTGCFQIYSIQYCKFITLYELPYCIIILYIVIPFSKNLVYRSVKL